MVLVWVQLLLVVFKCNVCTVHPIESYIFPRCYTEPSITEQYLTVTQNIKRLFWVESC
jgi:hypothetical protein